MPASLFSRHTGCFQKLDSGFRSSQSCLFGRVLSISLSRAAPQLSRHGLAENITGCHPYHVHMEAVPCAPRNPIWTQVQDEDPR